MRVIDSAASCNQGETALNFSQTGPQGAAGAPGQTRLLNFTRGPALPLSRGASKTLGSFNLPEGKWAITFTGGVKIPRSNAVKLKTGKLHAAALNAYRAVGFGGEVTCKMTVGDGSVTQVVGTSSLIGLLVPAVQTQHGAGGGGGTGKSERAAIYMNLLGNAPAGGAHGVLSCGQSKAQQGFPAAAAQIHDISVNAVQVNEVGQLNFTPGG
jgi:hypothetical protein